ncbi:MAG: ABC transporter permease [Caldilineaceae bacterium SB0662_bin_9]|uniref:ABC transporter permease n=1 Tax=Caldilineaceae bacterium SB0662_bin_9 TaxID=2605258 RepID=A0A6B1DS02_9CHLR|nr:ABC transporter permease [Caldilineaceae bacterium]MYD90510.1 ABC transporter permease [Caldilineaceae bacterium SB0662_bin_9]
MSDQSLTLPSAVSEPQAADVEINLSAGEIGQLSLWYLIWRRFLRNRLAVAATFVLLLLYLMVALAEFITPYDHLISNEDFVARAPQLPRFRDETGQFHFRPFVYGTTTELDTYNLDWVHKDDTTQMYPLKLFVKGAPYKLLGLFPSDRHLYGVDAPGTVFLLGTDRLGRDLFSRIIFGGRISLTVGLIGVSLTILFGSVMGTISGYFGGPVDTVIQRFIELLMSFPSIALWAALAAAMPADITIVTRFFLISIILSLIGWTSLARQVRAKVLAFREMEFSSAATAAGASHIRIIMVHMLPNALSHIIVIATLAIPGMILAETALSFLGLGILPPAVSWGTLLQDAQTVGVVIKKPWLMLPGAFVIVSVLSFNFLGDGIRDAVDPFAL